MKGWRFDGFAKLKFEVRNEYTDSKQYVPNMAFSSESKIWDMKILFGPVEQLTVHFLQTKSVKHVDSQMDLLTDVTPFRFLHSNKK